MPFCTFDYFHPFMRWYDWEYASVRGKSDLLNTCLALAVNKRIVLAMIYYIGFAIVVNHGMVSRTEYLVIVIAFEYGDIH